jgi:ABC-type antimicrobial peptide transport system permease subunit
LPDPLALMPSVRQVLRDMDSHVPAYRVQTMAQAVSRSLWRQRFQSEVLGVFAILALLLAAVGMYGVISYAVAQRSRELSVRIALGATRGHVMSLIVGQGTRLAAIGVVIGLAGAFSLTGVLRQLLYSVSPTDPFTFVVVPLALASIAIFASWVPARRAMRVDPVDAMRGD